jgi:ketosteroid isomerase-like protein
MIDVQSLEKTVRNLFATTDARDVNGIAAYLTDDIELRFGNNDPVIGKDAYVTMAAASFPSLTSVRHEIHSLWIVDGDVVITEMTVHYERRDGQQLSLPCTNIFRVRDGLIADYRVYMDANPAFA